MAHKVLYVEDEPSLAQIVSESLEHRGYQVTIAKDGKQAVDMHDNHAFDICVLDIMLPKMDGYSVAEILIQKEPSLPIIFLTAKTQTKDLIKGFEVGGRDYLRKPFSMEELIVRMNNLLLTPTKRESPNESYSIGSFTFNPNRYELVQGSNNISLSERESKILHLLCMSMNQSCDRKSILMSIWGDDSYYNSRNLDVYMNKLRKILSPDPSLEIMTLKGVGYVFKVSPN